MTVGSSPGGRLKEDLEVDGSRNTNLLRLWEASAPATPGRRLVVRHVQALSCSVRGPLAANDWDVAKREVMLIALVKGWSSNSACGGRRIALGPSGFAEFRAQLVAARATPADMQSLAPVDVELTAAAAAKERVIQHFDDVLAYFAMTPDTAGTLLDIESDIGPRVLRDIKFNASRFVTRAGDPSQPYATDIFTVGKDVPLSTLLGVESFARGDAGRGPHLGYQVARSVRGLEADPAGWVALSPYADLWSMQLRHVDVFAACLFLARLLYIARPRVLVTHSSKVCLSHHLFTEFHG